MIKKIFFGILGLIIVSVFLLSAFALSTNKTETESTSVFQNDFSSEIYTEKSEEYDNNESVSSSENDKTVQSYNRVEKYDKNIYETEIQNYSGIILPYSEYSDEDYIENTLFIGDSNTYGISGYQLLPSKNVAGMPSKGIQDILDEKCYVFSEGSEPIGVIEAVMLMQPDRIIVNFGTNNAGGMSEQAFTETYSSALASIKRMAPKVEIIVAAVLPVAKERSYMNISMTDIDNLNLALAQMCKEEGYPFLDYASCFKDETGYMNPDFVSDDGIHLNIDGLYKLLEYVDTHQYAGKKSFNVFDEIFKPNINSKDSSSSEDSYSSEKIAYDPFY